LYYDANGNANAATAVEIAVVGAGSHPAGLSVGDFTLVS
jgi:hypothetical protein